MAKHRIIVGTPKKKRKPKRMTYVLSLHLLDASDADYPPHGLRVSVLASWEELVEEVEYLHEMVFNVDHVKLSSDIETIDKALQQLAPDVWSIYSPEEGYIYHGYEG